MRPNAFIIATGRSAERVSRVTTAVARDKRAVVPRDGVLLPTSDAYTEWSSSIENLDDDDFPSLVVAQSSNGRSRDRERVTF